MCLDDEALLKDKGIAKKVRSHTHFSVLTDKALRFLAKNSKNVVKLHLCEGVTELAYVNDFPGISGLSVCGNIPREQDIPLFAERLPQLSLVSLGHGTFGLNSWGRELASAISRGLMPRLAIIHVTSVYYQDLPLLCESIVENLHDRLIALDIEHIYYDESVPRDPRAVSYLVPVIDVSPRLKMLGLHGLEGVEMDILLAEITASLTPTIEKLFLGNDLSSDALSLVAQYVSRPESSLKKLTLSFRGHKSIAVLLKNLLLSDVVEVNIENDCIEGDVMVHDKRIRVFPRRT
jgi:hypothetical protein